MAAIDVLAQRFRDFGGVSTATRAPLYSRIATAIADDVEVLRLLQHAPETQQMPVLLFAGVHYLLLEGLGRPLAQHYPNLSPDGTADGDPTQLFRRFALEHAGELSGIIARRNTQTNEVGRCSQFLPVFGLIAQERGALAHVDVGTSAGLNLLLSRYSYEFSPGGAVESANGSGTVELHCSTRGNVPVPRAMPTVARSIGLDIAPVDVLDDDAVRWLEACVWPDQADRFARLVAAIELARQHPPEIIQDDAVEGLARVVAAVASAGHPVVTNSWVLNYLPVDVQHRYVDELDRIGAACDLSWVVAESPAQTTGLPVPTTDPPEDITVVTLVRWRDGRRTVQRLGTTHPHGYWLHWERR